MLRTATGLGAEVQADLDYLDSFWIFKAFFTFGLFLSTLGYLL